MGLNIDRVNGDISKSSGEAPTLGGGTVSRQVMTTATATATYYANLATFTFPATNNVAANLNIVLTPKGIAGSYKPVIASVNVLQGTGGLSTSSQLEIVTSDETAIANDDLFLTTTTATNGTDIELYMQSIIAAAYDVVVLSESFDTGISVAWNDGATWSATDPTSGAATSVTSDRIGRDTYTPVLTFGGASTGITYSSQEGYITYHDGLMTINALLTLSSKGTATGDAAISLPATSSSNDTSTIGSLRITATSATLTGPMARLVPNSNTIDLQKNNGTAAAANITDTDFTNTTAVRISITVKVN